MEKKYKYNIGTSIGNYKIKDILGKGGNGEVYEVIDKSNNKFAMKILTRENDFREKYIRFKDEIKIVLEHQERNDGILPIIDKNIPESKDFEKGVQAWYVMPIAKTIRKEINKRVSKNKHEFVKVLSNILELANKIEYFHKIGISHRDIKPENIYFYKDRWVLSDFGLVDYPKKDDITRNYLGPKATIAPEMRLNAKTADGKIADVYSLAKTLWILVTDSKYAFDGLYDGNTTGIRLGDFIDQHIYVKPLEDLLVRATQQVPNERIRIEKFIEFLDNYINELETTSEVFTQEELENKDDDFILSYNSILYKKEEIMKELFLKMYHNEQGFIDLGFIDEVKILKKITYELSIEKQFIVSPIFRHTRNQSMLSVAVYFNFTNDNVKKACNIICSKENNVVKLHVMGYKSITYINDESLNQLVKLIEKIKTLD